jgi:hypothetical protein
MPVLARLQFCLIAMYFEDHNPPHFHVLGLDGREAQVRLEDLAVIKGVVERRAMSEALAWAKSNDQFLKETWDAFQSR